MTRPRLKRYQRETVELLTRVDGPPNKLGERSKVTQSMGQVSALITPLGAQEVLEYGLKAEQSLWRMELAVVPTIMPSAVRWKGQEMRLIKLESWQNYSVAIVEGVKPP